MEKQEKILLSLFISFILSLFILGVLADGWQKSLNGFIYLQIQPSRLLNDFFSLVGIGATLWNAASVGAIALGLILLLKTKLSGPTFAAIFTIIGFGMFGKTPLNILPIIFGVYLSGKFVGKTFQEYIIIALFGTALGPLVGFFAFEMGLVGIVGILAGISVGIIVGFFLPAIAISMLHMHQGYNLYNIGLTSGFLAVFAAAIIKISGHTFLPQTNWYQVKSPLLILLVPILSLILIITGSIFGKKTAWKDFWNIQKHSGRLPSDFMVIGSLEGSLINAGFIGIIGSIYVYLVGADFNGPVIGGLLTIIGFGTFGTHLKNSWSVVLGVIVCALIFGVPLTSPATILATIFVTTLSPLAGQFGMFAGFIAGFIHLVIVLQTGVWHGGMNLYNNGFAGGLTATLLVAIIQWYKNSKNNNV